MDEKPNISKGRARQLLSRCSAQVAILVLSLWMLGLMRSEPDPSDFSFELLFAMLGPQIFAFRCVVISLFSYLSLCVATVPLGLHLGLPAVSASLVGRAAALLSATVLSWLLRGRLRPGLPLKVAVGLWYLCVFAAGVIAASGMRFGLLWVILLAVIPVLVFARMRRIVSGFWRMMAVVAVYVTFRLAWAAGYSVIICGVPVRMTVFVNQCFLPLPGYMLLATIAAVVLGQIGGWNLIGVSNGAARLKIR